MQILLSLLVRGFYFDSSSKVFTTSGGVHYIRGCSLHQWIHLLHGLERGEILCVYNLLLWGGCQPAYSPLYNGMEMNTNLHEMCPFILLDLYSFFNINYLHTAIREDGMPGGRNKTIGPVQVCLASIYFE